MKPNNNNQIFLKAAILFFAVTFIWNTSFTRDKQQADEKKTAAIALSFYKTNDGKRMVVAQVSSKNDSGKLVFVQWVKINFYSLGINGKSLLRNVSTDEGGKAQINLPPGIPTDTSGATIIAAIENDKVYNDAEAQAYVKEANLTLTLSGKDSARLITVLALEVLPNGEQRPILNAEVNFGIQRLFGIAPLGDEATATTDDNGMATFKFPDGIKGDEKGKVVVVARMIDNDVYGNVEAASAATWGERLIPEKNAFPRALWEPRAPVLLITAFSIIFGGIWFTYAFVIFQLVKIKKQQYKPDELNIAI